MKVRNLYALLVTLVAAISLLLSCSDNDDPQPDPQPVLEQGEIPMADSIPSAYLGMNFIRQLTVTVGDCGGFFPNQPLISIYDNASDKEEATAKYDAELYFVRLADGKEYRPGEALPYSDERNPIGHHMDIYPAVKRDVPPLILGNIGNNVDDVLVMHWPQKDLKIFIRLYTSYSINPVPNTDKMRTTYKFGMFVNGVCVQDQHLKIVLQPDGTVKLFGRPDGLML